MLRTSRNSNAGRTPSAPGSRGRARSPGGARRGRAPRRHEVPARRGRGVRRALRAAGRGREPRSRRPSTSGRRRRRGRLGADRAPPVQQGAPRRGHFTGSRASTAPSCSRSSTASPASSARTLPVLLQVNAGNDPAKSGVGAGRGGAPPRAALGLKNLRVEGLMTVAPLSDDPEVARRTFAASGRSATASSAETGRAASRRSRWG
jgi:hypothetical protein